MSSILSLRGLSKSYGDVVAVNSIDLEVSEGEFVVLLGPSGCGKSTTLRLIAGFLRPTHGEVRLRGEVIASPQYVVPPERRGMAMVFQSFAVWPHMTVFQNVAYGLKLKRLPNSEIGRRVEEVLETVRMSGYAERYPSELSGGQQQRVVLARALAVNPDVLLMDEPLSNLDAALREEMRFEIRRLHQKLGFTTIYVTHDQAEAMVMGDRAVVMRAGRIDQVGPPRQLYESPANEFVASFLGKANFVGGRLVGPDRVRLGDRILPCRTCGSVAEGDDVLVVIRPSGLEISDARSDSQETLTAVVEDLVFLGSSQECQLYLPELSVRLSASLSPHARVEVGRETCLRIQGLVALPRERKGSRG